MSLGSAYHTDTSSNSFIIDHPKDAFSAKDQFAFVVSMDKAFNTFHLTVAIVQISSGGGSSVISSTPITLSSPQSNQLANQFLTGDVMGSNPPGKYRLQIENDSTILAQTDFTYKG